MALPGSRLWQRVYLAVAGGAGRSDGTRRGQRPGNQLYRSGWKRPASRYVSSTFYKGPVEQSHYDLVVARALLHHLASPEAGLTPNDWRVEAWRRSSGHRAGHAAGHGCRARVVRKFWEGWFRWAAASGIDYFVGRKVAPLLDSLGLQQDRGGRSNRSVQRRIALGGLSHGNDPGTPFQGGGVGAHYRRAVCGFLCAFPGPALLDQHDQFVMACSGRKPA